MCLLYFARQRVYVYVYILGIKNPTRINIIETSQKEMKLHQIIYHTAADESDTIYSNGIS